MISVDEALREILTVARPLPAETIPTRSAHGRTLAESIVSSVDSPPYTKAMMDGYAVQSSDLSGGQVTLKVLEEVTAGKVPSLEVTSGQATRIMTGAPLPSGADAVVVIERTRLLETGIVEVDDASLSAGSNVMPQGSSLRRGEEILTPSTKIRPIDIGLLCDVGQSQVVVTPRPRLAILSTGDELVPVEQSPAAGQIRNSNGPMLCALVEQTGGEPISLGIARDNRKELRSAVQNGLQADILLLSGGVSAGVLDLVPRVLAELGVEQVFHKVRLKPGKPLWFGLRPAEDRQTLIFGLPGNPVSSFVCFHLFVVPAIEKLAGREVPQQKIVSATLTHDVRQRGDRCSYLPALTGRERGKLQVALVPWQGSADIRGFAAANALAIFPQGEHDFRSGTQIDILPI